MERQLKKAWLTEASAGLSSLSLESAKINPDWQRIVCDERVFPVTPTPEHPLRHVIVIGLLNDNDLSMLRDAIDQHLHRG